jgi:hypothetical protein
LNLRGRKWREAGEYCIMRSFITYTLQEILLVIKCRRLIGAGHVARMEEMRIMCTIVYNDVQYRYSYLPSSVCCQYRNFLFLSTVWLFGLVGYG